MHQYIVRASSATLPTRTIPMRSTTAISKQKRTTCERCGINMIREHNTSNPASHNTLPSNTPPRCTPNKKRVLNTKSIFFDCMIFFTLNTVYTLWHWCYTQHNYKISITRKDGLPRYASYSTVPITARAVSPSSYAELGPVKRATPSIEPLSSTNV